MLGQRASRSLRRSSCRAEDLHLASVFIRQRQWKAAEKWHELVPNGHEHLYLLLFVVQHLLNLKLLIALRTFLPTS